MSFSLLPFLSYCLSASQSLLSNYTIMMTTKEVFQGHPSSCPSRSLLFNLFAGSMSRPFTIFLFWLKLASLLATEHQLAASYVTAELMQLFLSNLCLCMFVCMSFLLRQNVVFSRVLDHVPSTRRCHTAPGRAFHKGSIQQTFID